MRGCPSQNTIRRDAVNPSLGALGSASMPRTARRIGSGPGNRPAFLVCAVVLLTRGFTA